MTVSSISEQYQTLTAMQHFDILTVFQIEQMGSIYVWFSTFITPYYWLTPPLFNDHLSFSSQKQFWQNITSNLLYSIKRREARILFQSLVKLSAAALLGFPVTTITRLSLNNFHEPMLANCATVYHLIWNSLKCTVAQLNPTRSPLVPPELTFSHQQTLLRLSVPSVFLLFTGDCCVFRLEYFISLLLFRLHLTL